jgi:tetratricopeptide (TPR) repeat protein
MTVNFHALELYFKGLGGKAIHSIYNHENVNMFLFLLGDGSHDFIETSMAYNEIIESIGPDDFYIIKKGIVPLGKSLTTKELLTFLRYTVWDSRTFLEFYNILLDRIVNEENFPKDELITVINNVWEHYFPIGEEGDLAYYLGSIMAYLGCDSEALKFFQYSCEFYGAGADIYYEMAVCCYNLQQFEKALEYINKCMAFDSDFEDGKKLKEMIDEALSF